MASLWFVVPAHGRVELTRICLTQLRHTCDQLAGFGIVANAVVIADDENLDTANHLGFWGYEQDNSFLGRKFNDGYELAAREGVDYVVPLGSDDWIHQDLIAAAELPTRTIRCARRLVMVAEDGDRYMRMRIDYDGGIGMRIIPIGALKALGYRPAEEDQARGIDTVTLKRIIRAHNHRQDLLEYVDTESDFQIVDFKSPGANLNTWQMCRIHATSEENDPWAGLLEQYPTESVAAMRAFYEAARSAPSGA